MGPICGNCLFWWGLGSTDTLLNDLLASQETQHDFNLRKVQLEEGVSLDCPEADLRIEIESSASG